VTEESTYAESPTHHSVNLLLFYTSLLLLSSVDFVSKEIHHQL